LFNLMIEWTGSDELLKELLVGNPARLYHF